MKVLRLCSVFEPPVQADLGRASWDPVGGMQFHTGQLTRSLDPLGVQQTVITAYVPGGPRRERWAPGATVYRLGWAVPIWRQLYAVPAAALLLRIVRCHNIVHVHLGEDLAVLPLALGAARLANVPLVLTIHCSLRRTLVVGDVRSAILRTLGGWLEGRTVRRAAATITLTQHLRSELVAEGCDARALFAIPSGFDPRLFADDPPDPLPEIPRPRIAYVGRLAHQKGVQTLMRSLHHLRSAADVVIVGDGPLKQELQTMAGTVPHRRVHFTGFVPHDTVARILTHAQVLVLPSVYEELGSILVEAMAAGTPIVATRVGGIPELLEDGDAGLLVTPGDPVALAAAVDRVLGDQALATHLQAVGRRRADTLSWDSLARQTLDVYERVLREAAK